MKQATNQLVGSGERWWRASAAVVGAFALGAALFVGHAAMCTRRMAMDDNSVSALTALDHAMEAVASRVTPAVVNVAVTSKHRARPETRADGPMQKLAAAVAAVLRADVPQGPQQPQIEHGIGSGIIISPDGYIRYQQPRGGWRDADQGHAERPPHFEREGGRRGQAERPGGDQGERERICRPSRGATRPSCSRGRRCWPSAARSATSSSRSRAAL